MTPADEGSTRSDSDGLERTRLRTIALSRWENEGGAGSGRRHREPALEDEPFDAPPLTNTELVHLRIRVIALENLVIAMLAEAPERQLALVRDMAEYISPRPGYSPHPLTIRAAGEMLSLVDRADQFRSTPAD